MVPRVHASPLHGIRKVVGEAVVHKRYPDKVIDHTNLYWGNHAAPGREAGAVKTADVMFG